MTLADRWGFWRLTSDAPTTLRKDMTTAKGPPLDHAFANARALDMGARMEVSDFAVISDHLPLVGALEVPQLDFCVWKWPRVSVLPSATPASPDCVPWQGDAATMTEWTVSAQNWISEACGVKCEQKTTCTSMLYRPPQHSTDKHFATICAAQRAVRYMQGRQSNSIQQWKSLGRKCKVLGVDARTLDELEARLMDCMKRHLENRQKAAIKDWKERAAAWSLNSRQLFRYLRNLPPSKAAAIAGDMGVTSHPGTMASLLVGFWAGVESWPHPQDKNRALDWIDDHLSLFLPCVKIKPMLTPDHFISRVRKMKKHAAPGVDGWSVPELIQLPGAAWQNLIRILGSGLGWGLGGLSLLFRRVPIEKSRDDIPGPQLLRPIDIYSVLWRLIASVQTECLTLWRTEVLHPTQYASKGGVVMAAAKVGYWCEAVLHRRATVFAVSIDLTKLFNTLDADVCARLAHYMGLDEKTIELMSFPLQNAKGVWRLPWGAISPHFLKERGLGQGMSTSVLYAEVFVASFLWRLVTTTGVDTAAYIDDLTIVAQNKETLITALNQLFQFADMMKVGISLEKTHLWGSDGVQLTEIASERGWSVTQTVESLGADWPLADKENPKYEKDLGRIEKMLERLRRLIYLPSPLVVKAGVISIGCLSLLDFSVTPSLSHLKKTKMAVRKALGLSSGAPEIVYNVLTKGSLDPHVRWFVTLTRFWHSLAGFDAGIELLRTFKRSCKNSRLSALARECKKQGFIIDHESLQIHGDLLPFHITWREFRPKLIEALKHVAWGRLALRRPLVFGGLNGLTIDLKMHRKLLSSVKSYEAIILCRLWSGAAMTRAHRHTLDSAFDPICECGMEPQTVGHLLYRCPERESESLLVSALSTRSPCESEALLCLKSCPEELLGAWKHVCRRAVSLLSQIPSPPRPDTWDRKGHVIEIEASGRYAYCRGCYVSRKIADAKYIAVRQCDGGRVRAREGEQEMISGHHAVLFLKVWKLRSLRPAFRCATCNMEWWATSSPRTSCQ